LRRRYSKERVVVKSKLFWLSIGLTISLLAVVGNACGTDEGEDAAPAAAVATTAPAPTAAAAAVVAPTAAPAMEKEEEPAEEGIGKFLIGKLEGPTIITDRSKYPASFNEAPQLAALVASGDLPPVAERVSDDPQVLKPLHEIGEYGGIINRAVTGPTDHSNGVRFGGNDSLLHWDYTGTNLVPLLARDWEVSEDGKTTTFHLRRNMKWSDGEPFTADDFMFWYEDIYLNEEITPSKSSYFITDNGGGWVEKVDDHTVQFKFHDPYYAFQVVVTGPTGFGGQAHDGKGGTGGGYGPKHYLSKFHPKYVGQEEADRLAAAEGFETWVELFLFKRHWANNADLPVVSGWMTKVPITEQVWILERNPYFWGVDTEGNQLPYLDEIHLTVAENLEVLNLRAVAGEIDYQSRHIDLQKLPVFLENQEKGDYSVSLDPGGIGADAALFLNQLYEADPVIAELMQTADFRRALSLGIDRDQLNETFWLGLGTPGSIVTTEESPYNPGPEWRTKWSTHDPERANGLLDGIGLTEKDSEGFRMRPDGSGKRLILDFQTYLGFMNFTDLAEMIKEDWEDIGIFVTVKELERGLNYTKIRAGEHQIAVEITWGSENMFAHGQGFFPSSPRSSLGRAYGTWFVTKGEEGLEPPPEMQKLMKTFREAFGAPLDVVNRTGKHYELGQEVWKIAIDQQYVIGTVGLAPGIMGLRIAKNDLGNIPERIFNGSSTLHPRQARPEMYYWKSPENRQ
jgi:peptide/nickel transport system substrate-binding protein